jgi:predicted PurR-regulated permease PerM
MAIETPPPSSSPTWSSTTKLVIGLTFIAIVAALLVQFRSIIGPLILAFILAYLLHPVAARFSRLTGLPWRTSVNLIYLLLLVLLIGLSTLTGLAVVQQLQSLVGFVEDFIPNLQTWIADLSTSVYRIGPFVLDFSQLNLQALSDQLLSSIQPLLGRVTSIISSFAASAGVTLGWTLFVLLVSYFLLADTGQVPDTLVIIDIPAYNADIQRLVSELKNIWNAFLRGQLIIIILVVLSYTSLLTVLDVRYAIGLAILAGLARFVPYVGPLVTGIITFLVALLQGENYFGLEPIQYAILVVVLAVILDQIFDNLVTPRFLGQTLGVHPAAVLVAALIATNLIGIIGLVLAAPVLATLKLLGRYIVRKMLDLDPWPQSDRVVQPVVLPWTRGMRRMRAWWRTIQRRT